MKAAKKIAEYKIYLDRSRIYFSYIQFFMVLGIFFKQRDNFNIELSSSILYPIAIFVVLLFMIFFGSLDTKLGIRTREIENNASHNPILSEIKKEISEIKSKLK